MRYLETQERSAEILRLTLPLMSRQQAAFHPMSYALWYEHVAGINPRLTAVLDGRLSSNASLNNEDVWRLYAQYIVARDVEAFERIQQQLRVALADTARMTVNAGAEATQFGTALAQHKRELGQAISLDVVQKVVEGLLTDTERMRTTTMELSQLLETRAKEVEDLTARLEQSQIEAMLDPLTGLHNRRGFERQVAQWVAGGGVLENATLLLADIDLFKAINDTHGHLLGDKVLRTVAEIVRSSVKGRDFAARLGGEEFAVFLPDTAMQGAAALAEQIRASVASGRIRRADVLVGHVTVSIGVAVATAGDSLERLLERADTAMYAAKRAGRNQVRVAPANSNAVPRVEFKD